MFKEDLKKVKAFALDVDGVLSRQEMPLSAQGELVRTACAKDGYALMYCVRKGYPVAIISGGRGPGMRERFERLGITEIHLGVADKVEVFEGFLQRHGLSASEVLFMGDDIPDYRVMSMVGFPVCPADACEEIKSVSRYISDLPGGLGCVRDVISQVLKARGDWMDVGCHVKSM